MRLPQLIYRGIHAIAQSDYKGQLKQLETRKLKLLPSMGSVRHACERQSDKPREFFEQANEP